VPDYIATCPSGAGEGPGPPTPPQPARVDTVRQPGSMEVIACLASRSRRSSAPVTSADASVHEWDIVMLGSPGGVLECVRCGEEYRTAIVPRDYVERIGAAHRLPPEERE
jgi:hypothetical protein